MQDQPVTRYTKSGDGYVAYQVTGEGPDLVFVPGWISHLEVCWDIPPLASFLRRLGSFCRVIAIDKRGTGLSDPLPPDRVATLEERMDDVRAVMDAVGSARAALLGISEGGPMNILFAATHPERTVALILFGTYAKMARDEDYPIGYTYEVLDQYWSRLEGRWGTGAGLGALAPSMALDPRMRELWGRYQRMSASPGAAVSLLLLSQRIDLRHVLPTVRVPTLVLHREGDRFVPPEHGRYLADNIPGARYVALDGDDHLFFAGDFHDMLGEMEEFLTGHRGSERADRILATVLFTDIVNSTAKAADLGDRAWRDLLDRFEGLVQRQLERFRGRAVKATGDGYLATFDGPARGVQCATAIADAVRQLGIRVRTGLHTGECEMRGNDVAGIAVHIGARVADAAAPGEVLVSSTVKDLVAGSGLTFEERGSHALKGIPGTWRLFAAQVAVLR